MMKVPYNYLEVEYIENQYDQQVPLSVIAENVNHEYHKGEKVRSVNSIKYVINQVNNNDEWVQRLEEKRLSALGEE